MTLWGGGTFRGADHCDGLSRVDSASVLWGNCRSRASRDLRTATVFVPWVLRSRVPRPWRLRTPGRPFPAGHMVPGEHSAEMARPGCLDAIPGHLRTGPGSLPLRPRSLLHSGPCPCLSPEHPAAPCSLPSPLSRNAPTWVPSPAVPLPHPSPGQGASPPARRGECGCLRPRLWEPNLGGAEHLQVTFMGVIMGECDDNVALEKGRKAKH